MKKILAIILFLVVFVTLSSNAETIEKDKGYISVNESITKEISPNQAEISISIETSDKSLKQASEDNKVIANKVYSSLKALLGTNDYIKTSNYSAKPVYIYTKENKKVLDKYSVSNMVIIKTKSTDLVSKLIDTAIAQRATNIDNLQFTATDYDNACNEALSELTKKAQTKANSVANSINSQIIGIKSINATCNTDNGPRPYYAMMARGAMDSASSTPIESGKIKIYANLDASFYVK
jgi:uncharacterized protein